jgi:hypothetical protein
MPKDLLDTCLELFTVLYLKSDNVVKVVLLRDLFSVQNSIKQNEVTVFAENKFIMKIIMMRIAQFKHCLKANTDCPIKSNVAQVEDETITDCPIHGCVASSEATIDLTKS